MDGGHAVVTAPDRRRADTIDESDAQPVVAVEEPTRRGAGGWPFSARSPCC